MKPSRPMMVAHANPVARISVGYSSHASSERIARAQEMNMVTATEKRIRRNSRPAKIIKVKNNISIIQSQSTI